MSAYEKLVNVVIPTEVTECSNVKCTRTDHKCIIDLYVEDVLKAINDTAFECLPVSGNTFASKKSNNCIANWSSDVKPFKEKSMFWAAVWASAGKPLNTTLHQIMKRSRNIYHFQVKKL